MNAVTWSPRPYLHLPLFLFLHTPTSLPPLSARPPIGCEPRLRFLLWLWVLFFVFFAFCFCFCAVTNEEPATVLEQKQNAKSSWPLQTQRQCRVHGEWHAVRRSVTAAQAKNDTATDTTSLIPPGAVGLSVLRTMYRATSTFNKN